MNTKSIQPNDITHYNILDAFGKKNQMDELENYFEKLKKKGEPSRNIIHLVRKYVQKEQNVKKVPPKLPSQQKEFV